jgi:hypothetical protein
MAKKTTQPEAPDRSPAGLRILRDDHAREAMGALIGSPRFSGLGADDVARMAYGFADAMLAARDAKD